MAEAAKKVRCRRVVMRTLHKFARAGASIFELSHFAVCPWYVLYLLVDIAGNVSVSVDRVQVGPW
jgi:hypothetical protein